LLHWWSSGASNSFLSRKETQAFLRVVARSLLPPRQDIIPLTALPFKNKVERPPPLRGLHFVGKSFRREPRQLFPLPASAFFLLSGRSALGTFCLSLCVICAEPSFGHTSTDCVIRIHQHRNRRGWSYRNSRFPPV